MSWVWLEVAVLVVFVALVAGLALRPRRGAAGVEYARADALFSEAERSFYQVLQRVAGEQFEVLGKVRVADVLVPAGRGDRREWRGRFNRISAKHFDFVLCRASDLGVVCAIELDDRSHQRADRRQRDAFLDQACQGAGLPLIRFRASTGYSARAVSEEIASAVGGDARA